MSFFVVESEQQPKEEASNAPVPICFVIGNKLSYGYADLIRKLRGILTIDLSMNGFDTTSLATENWGVVQNVDWLTVITKIPMGSHDTQMMMDKLAISMQQSQESIVCRSIVGDSTQIVVLLSDDEDENDKASNNMEKSGCGHMHNSNENEKEKDRDSKTTANENEKKENEMFGKIQLPKDKLVKKVQSGSKHNRENGRKEWSDSVNQLLWRWRVWMNSMNNNELKLDEMDMIISQCNELIKNTDSVKVFIGSLRSNLSLVENSFEVLSKYETSFVNYLRFLLSLIETREKRILNKLVRYQIDEKLFDTMAEYSYNKEMTKTCGDCICLLVRVSDVAFERFIHRKKDVIGKRLEQCLLIDLTGKEEYVIGLIDIICVIFEESNDAQLTLRYFSSKCVISLIKIVDKLKCSKISMAFCGLLTKILKLNNVTTKIFEKRIIFNNEYNLFSMLLDIVMNQIENNDYAIIEIVFSILNKFGSNSLYLKEIKGSLKGNEKYDCLLKYMHGYFDIWKFYCDRMDFRLLVSAMMQFLVIFETIKVRNKYFRKIALPMTMNENVTQERIQLFIYQIHMVNVNSSDNSNNNNNNNNNVNNFDVRSEILFGNNNNSNNSIGNKNCIYDTLGDYMCDGSFIYTFCDTNAYHYNFGLSLNENVTIGVLKRGYILVNKNIQNVFFNSDVRHLAIVENEMRRDDIVNGLMGKNELCWMQRHRLGELELDAKETNDEKENCYENVTWYGEPYANQNEMNIWNMPPTKNDFIFEIFRNIGGLKIHDCFDIAACYSSNKYNMINDTLKGKYAIFGIDKYINCKSRMVLDEYYLLPCVNVKSNGRKFIFSKFGELCGYFIGLKDKNILNYLKLNLMYDIEKIKLKINSLTILSMNDNGCAMFAKHSIECVCFAYHMVLILLCAYYLLVSNVINAIDAMNGNYYH